MCSSTPTSRPGAGSPASRYRRPRRWCGFRAKVNGDSGGKANGFRPIPEWRSRSPECFSKAQRRWTSYRHNEPARWCSRGGRPASRSRGLVFVRIADQPLAVRLPGGRRAKIRARSRGAECGRSRIGWFFSRLRFSRNSRLFGYTGCSGAAPSRSPGALSCRWPPLPNSTRPPTACPQAAARAAGACRARLPRGSPARPARRRFWRVASRLSASSNSALYWSCCVGCASVPAVAASGCAASGVCAFASSSRRLSTTWLPRWRFTTNPTFKSSLISSWPETSVGSFTGDC